MTSLRQNRLCYDPSSGQPPRAAEGAAVVRLDRRRIMAERTDEELMAGIGRGDHGAFRELIGRRLQGALALAQRMIGERAAAEDIAQEAFLRVWRHAAKWKTPDQGGRARFGTWFYRVVVNLCIDRKRRPRPVPLDAVAEPADPADDAATVVQRGQVARQVAAAVAELPERQRAALVLCAYEGHTAARAAEILSSTERAVESLLVRARRNLRKSLRPLLEKEFLD